MYFFSIIVIPHRKEKKWLKVKSPSFYSIFFKNPAKSYGSYNC